MKKIARLFAVCQIASVALFSCNLFAQRYVTFTIPLSEKSSLLLETTNDGKSFIAKGIDVGEGLGTKVFDDESGKLNAWVNGPLVEPDGSYTGKFYVHKAVKDYNTGKYYLKTASASSWVDPAPIGQNFGDNNGIFGRDENGKMFLVKYGFTRNIKNVHFAFQNGPILLLNGDNLNSSGTKAGYRKSGIGFKQSKNNDFQDIVVILTLDPANFYDLGRMFAKEKCDNAIYLDGIVNDDPDLNYIGMGAHGYIDTVKPGRRVIQFFNVGEVVPTQKSL